MQEYYNRRAQEYEQIYRRDDPARQAELTLLAEAMKGYLAGLNVLEVACGTGFWTAILANAARSITATDASEEMLAIATSKGLPANVTFRTADAYSLANVAGSFNGGLANFWFSHVPISRIAAFLDGLHSQLAPASQVFMADNVFIPDAGGELVYEEGNSDTYKRRQLADGSEHLILKNYYTADQLQAIFAPRSDVLDLYVSKYYWWISYSLP